MPAMNFNFLCPGPATPAGRSVGIIGAGPSGLAAAGHLSCLGYQVEVYDKLPKPGGLMLFGIPGHRIPRQRIADATRRMEREHGVVFHPQTKICCSAPMFEEEGDHFCREVLGLKDLVMRHDASIICTGSWKSRRMGIEGEGLPGVYSGLEFLFPIRAARYASSKVKTPEVKGKDVIVVGAGHSAVDAAHGAVSLGAASVTMLYRRTAREAPCGTYEIERLKEMGVTWRELATPLKVLGSQSAEGLEARIGGEVETLPAQAVIAAIGEIATPPFAKELGLEEVRKGEVHWLHMTAIENLFVAGDALTGPSKIGKAIYSGLKAARSLANWLDLKAQNRLAEYAYDDLVAKDERFRK
ncbi:FAD-dependent oxidoreductase [Fundidesulfovibrio soli]|uniref:FAD-dependent oxidoreductase n=1 Tax=Fundidesulfovibrio soli TaxID=2922716 RepID=UPI001FAF446C